ncbi:hypothetical protein [Streptomyces syringium]|uniref:hypothetical protein n=1 Tax=Streptomyces syringium TaxID=76729 RepID=UPI003404C7C1
MPADANGDLHVTKYRQDVHYLSPAWLGSYKPIRSHNEGANGRFKSSELDIGNPKHRPAPGQVTQTLLVAVMLTIANLTVLETWLEESTGGFLTDADYAAITTAELVSANNMAPTAQCPVSGRPPPASS